MRENSFELNIDTERPEELVGKDLIFEDPDRDRSSVMTIKKIEPLSKGMTSSWVVKAVVEDKNLPGKELAVGLKK